MKKIVAVSGGFDPLTFGHTRMILEAGKLGEVIVIANSQEWLTRKKGFCFYPTWEERAEILGAIRGVVAVERVDDSDGTVCEALRRLRPAAFCNGGDRKIDSTPEVNLCNELGIELIWNVGTGGKISSSSELTYRATEAKNRIAGATPAVQIIDGRTNYNNAAPFYEVAK